LIHTAPKDRSRAINRYARAARLAPETDEALVLEAMRRARFSIISSVRRHTVAGPNRQRLVSRHRVLGFAMTAGVPARSRLGSDLRPKLLADIGGAMIPAMGRDRGEQATPDLFSAETVRDGSPSPIKPITATQPTADPSSQRHVLPKNLRKALKHLGDGELDLLHAATVEEMGRRGRLLPTDQTKNSSRMDKSSHKRQVGAATVSLTRGQVNAVLAAFKAGIKPSLIARQFGISQSDVRKVLAMDAPGRGTID
jgi:hypothetical protein